jgi:fructose transport system permease protein
VRSSLTFVAVFGILVGGKFFNAFSLTLILQQVAIVGIVGAAQTLVILTAGIDLSVGAVKVLSSVVMGQFTFRYGIPVPISILCGLACGALCGFINGWLIAKMKLPPFIVTLGTWQVFNATKYLYSKNETIRGQDIEAQAPLLQLFGIQIKFGGAVFTLGVIFMVLLVVFLWYVLNYTAWGRRLYAVGDDPEAAQLSGIRVDRMLIAVYTLSGLICGFAGWVLIGRIGSVSPTSGEFSNIESITAVVIGGISLFGGRGYILGMIFGGLIVGVFPWVCARNRPVDLLPDRVLIISAVRRPMDQKGFGLSTMAKKAKVDEPVPLLTARGLVKRYGRVTALDHADFDLYPGEILAVIGDNGAGKSSLIKVICGAVLPDEGEIKLDGKTLNFKSP